MNAKANPQPEQAAQPSVSGCCLVVGYDRGPAAQHALWWAVRQLPANGHIVIVFACRALHAPNVQSDQERRSFAGAAMDELLMEADMGLLDRAIVTEIADQDPVSALLDAAARHNANAIVVGAQRHSPLHRAIGTVTSELMMRSPVPVTAVPDVSGASKQ